MPAAISDSSTLIHLAALGRLILLREYYTEVLIPPAVWKEVVEEGRGRPGAREVEEAARVGWLKVVAATDEPLVRLLKRELQDGEAEALALAVERQELDRLRQDAGFWITEDLYRQALEAVGEGME